MAIRRASSEKKETSFASYPNGRPLLVRLHGDVVKTSDGNATTSVWRLHREGQSLRLTPNTGMPADYASNEALAVIEAAFALYPGIGAVILTTPGDWLTTSEAFFQQRSTWMTGRPSVPSAAYTETHGRRHPRRPAKPTGIVYRRWIPWLSATLSFRTVDHTRDLATFHRWMNDPRVAYFWQEEGDESQHHAYLEAIAADARVISLFGCIDGQPFGYFEVYWAKEDRIAPFCDADDYDRGWHALVGEASFCGKPFVSAWMPSISHLLFLDEPRTRRLVIEPRIDNERMIRSLITSGYDPIKEFDFPHKRAALCVLSRERFFTERRWAPFLPILPVQPDSFPGNHHADS